MSATRTLPSPADTDDRPDTPSGPTPAELMAAAARSDADAWGTLIDRHARLVTSVAKSHGLSEADTADVVQIVWMRLLEHIDRIRHPERVAGWLVTTTRNECMRVWRLRNRVSLLADPAMLELIVDDTDEEPAVETQDRDRQLRAAVATLPGHQQEILRLLMSDPAPSYVEVAAILGIPVGSIGPNRQRCLRALRARCMDACIGPAA